VPAGLGAERALARPGRAHGSAPGNEAHLTKREYQLLQFLLDHPHRFFNADQIKDRAWAEPGLFPEEVRNYVRRLRKILSDLEIPADIMNRPQKGYSLVFRADP